MNLSAVENDIIARLTAQITVNAPKIQSWPNNPKTFQLLHPKGAVLVRYAGSTYEAPTPNRQAKAVQNRTSQWAINVITKSLKKTKGHQGAYGLLEEIRTALVGYTPASLSDASIMSHVSDGFEEEEAGTWIYSTTFEFTLPEGEA